MKYANLPPNKKIGKWVWNDQAKLGAGAYGKVFLGHPEANKYENVAIKSMDMAQLSEAQELLEALNNELMILIALKGKKNCVGLLDQIKTGANQFIVQPFCNGGNLREFLTKKEKVQEQEALKMLHEILNGFKEMVELDFCHRDVKPENTFLHDGICKVADYGFACKVNGKMMTLGCGTPTYMSPQISMNQPYSMKNDVWAVGIMYYEMLFGKQPWDWQTENDLVEMPRRIPLRFPHGVQVSEMSKNFLKGCLAFDERNRWSWQKIFSEKIFLNYQQAYQNAPVEQQKPIDETAQRFLSNIQQVVNNGRINIEHLFSQYDSGDKKLDVNEFTQIIQSIDSNCNYQICQQVFNKLDPNRDGFLSLVEFKQLMQTDFNKFVGDNNFLNEMRAKQCIKTLSLKIAQDHLNIAQVLSYFDVNKDGVLCVQEFYEMVKSIDPDLTVQEAQYIFNKFDSDQSGSISVPELTQQISQQVNQYASSLQQQSNNDSLSVVKRVLKQNNISINYILQYFDVDRNGIIDYNEFAKLMIAIDSRIDQIHIDEIFNQVSSNKRNCTPADIMKLLR